MIQIWIKSENLKFQDGGHCYVMFVIMVAMDAS